MDKVAGLFKNSYNSVATLEKGSTGFECTGIFPYCPHRFTAIHFAPFTVSKNELVLHFIKFTHKKFTSPNLANANFSISGPLYSRNDNVADVEDEEDVDGDLEPLLRTPQPVLQSRAVATVLFPSLNRATSRSNLEETEDLAQALDLNEEENLVANTNLDEGPIDPEQEPQPCCSKSLTLPPIIVSPSSIFSRPKIVKKRCVKKKRTQRSEALTESPFKNELIKQMEEKKNEKKKTTRGKKENSKQKTGSPKIKKRKLDGKDNNKNKAQLSNKDDDTECIFCSERYSNSRKGDDSIESIVCKRWAHASCADVLPHIKSYSCDLCQ